MWFQIQIFPLRLFGRFILSKATYNNVHFQKFDFFIQYIPASHFVDKMGNFFSSEMALICCHSTTANVVHDI